MNRVLFISFLLITSIFLHGQTPVKEEHLLSLPNFFSHTQSALFETLVQDELEEEGDMPLFRMKHFYDMRKVVDGPNPLSNRWTVYQNYRQQNAQSRNYQQVPEWTSLGPNTLRSFGGRMIALAFDPMDTQIIWAGSAEGGLWKTTNGGDAWMPMTDYLPAVGVSAIAVNPQNGKEIVIGTGEGKSLAVTFKPGIGIFKSVDGGQTWNSTSLNFDQREGVSAFDLVWHPTEDQILYLAATNGFWISRNSGQTWQRKKTGRATSIIINPINPNLLYVAMQGEGIYKSADGGSTLTKLNGGLPAAGRIGLTALAISASNPNLVLASITDAANNRLLGLFKTDDGGDSWQSLSDVPAYMTTNGGIGQGWYNNEVAIDPKNPAQIYVGGITFWRTKDGGNTWDQHDLLANNSNPVKVYVDQHAIAFSPHTNDLWIANDGGIAQSKNGGDTWVLKNRDLITGQYYKIASSNTDPNFIIGGFQDHGLQRLANASLTKEWTQWLIGDGVAVNIHPSNKGIVYGDDIRGNHYKNVNAGANNATTFLINQGINPNDGVLFFAPTVLDNHNPNTLFSSTATSIYKTTNGGGIWNKKATIPSVREIAISPVNSNYVFASSWDFSGNHSFWISKDGGETWTKSPNSPGWRVTDIEADPIRNNIIYVTRNSAFVGNSHILKSEDFGETWISIAAKLPDIGTNDLAINPYAANQLYLATDIGVFATTDGGTEWFEFNNNLPLVYTLDIHINPTDTSLIVGTHGRGAWKTSAIQPDLISATITPTTKADLPFSIQGIAPNPFDKSVAVNYQIKQASEVTYQIFNTTGQLVYKEHLGKKGAGDHQLQWHGQTLTRQVVPSGIYYVQLLVDQLASTIKIIKK